MEWNALLSACEEREFPLELLAMSLQAYMAPRIFFEGDAVGHLAMLQRLFVDSAKSLLQLPKIINNLNVTSCFWLQPGCGQAGCLTEIDAPDTLV